MPSNTSAIPDFHSNAPRFSIGILHSQAGFMASSEMPLIDAALMAVDEINQQGGILGHQICPVVGNGASSAIVFKAQLRQMIFSQKISTFFGCWTSDVRKELIPILEEHNAMLWYPLQYEGLESSRQIFYTGLCPNQQVAPAVDWLLNHQGKRFFLVGSDYVYPRTVHRQISAQVRIQGGEIVGEQFIPLEGSDFTSVIDAIHQAQPTAIFSTLNGDSNLAFYRHYQAAGFSPETMPIMSVSVAEDQIAHVGQAAVGHYLAWNYFASMDNPHNRAFVQAFQQRYGPSRRISAPIEAAYSQIYLWKQAVEAAGSFEIDDVRVAAYGERMNTPSGPVTLEYNHHVTRYCRIGHIQPNLTVDMIDSSEIPVKPMPWLGVEDLNFSNTALVIDMLGEVSQTLQQKSIIQQKSDDLQEITVLLEEQIIERKRAEQEMKLLLSVSQSMNRAVDLEKALKTALEQICEFTHWPYGEIWFPNAAKTQLKNSAVWHLSEGQLTQEQSASLRRFRSYTEQTNFGIDEGFLGSIYNTAEAQWTNDFGLYGAVGIPILSLPISELWEETSDRAAAATLDTTTTGQKVLAIMIFLLPETRDEDTRLIKLISAVASQLGSIVQQKKAEEVLRHKNEQLAKTLRQLNNTQDELIQSEKMAALGQLVAGVAHEINTPLGAICSSVQYISDFVSQDLEKFPDFFRSLSPDRQRIFVELLDHLRKPKSIQTSRERRKARRALVQWLESESIEAAHELGELLVDLDIHKKPEWFMPILKEADGQVFLEAVHSIGGLCDSARDISIAAERASKVVFALKTYAHYDHSGERVNANVVDGIEAILTLYQNKLKHSVTLVRDYDEDLPPISCYPDELNQVWTNLIHNALQAMDDRGTLLIGLRNLGYSLEITVTDSGAGIPVEIRDKIFQPFFTTKPPGEGSGLGLDIVRKIIEKHGGAIAFDSVPGKTTFVVNLPLQPRVIKPTTTDISQIHAQGE